MSDKKKKLNIPADLETADPSKIKGYSMNELRHRRAMVLLQKEFCKEKMSYGVLKLKNSSPFSKNYSGKSKHLGRAGAIAGKLLGGLNYLDYAVLGFSIFNNVKKAVGLFKK